MTRLYFAPINKYGNHVYRHMLLKYGADYVFSELILANHIEENISSGKLKVIEEDIPRTIFQVGVSSKEEINEAIKEILKHVGKVSEINLNMGCPDSRMKKKRLCGGLLFYPELMGELCKHICSLAEQNGFIPSVKLRIGLSEDDIKIDEFLKVIFDAGIRKVYVHARTLRQSYQKKANYEPLLELKKKYSDMEIVLNGDVFSYDAFLEVDKIPNDGMMIGRGAVYNPLIFEHIKNKVYAKKGDFNPVHLDPSLLVNGEVISLNEQKKEFIRGFLNAAISEGLALSYTKNNIAMMLRGVTGYKDIARFISEANNLEKIKEMVLKFIS